ncbi:MAG: GNAT family N-acetyltransferase [Catenulispora sp.]|nr:GNAT family N-acetyltransferase [Catenulispora sp.]
MPAPTVRLYRPEDRDAVYDICIRTAADGGDARELYRDHDLLPDMFAGPYTVLEPDLAFVLDDGGRAVGYVVGTSDTPRFVRDFREHWLPKVGPRHPKPAGEPTTLEESMTALLHNPEHMLAPESADYPAHLHIDLLPEYQGRGFGRLLLTTLFAALNKAGAERVHLVMSSTNTNARLFYDRMGFHEIPVADTSVVTYLGRATGA